MANEFLVSVADAILRDPTTKAGIAYGKANLSSAFNITTQKTEVRGGIGNGLLYTYFHDRMIEISIEQAIFSAEVVALNAGTSVASGTVSVLKTECLVLSASGSGTCSETPTDVVNVFQSDGTIQDLTAVGSVITASGADSQVVDVIYPYSVSADRITVDAATPPSIVDLTLQADVRDNEGTLLYKLQINVPSFQISGNYNMALAANGVSSQSLDGTSNVVENTTDCTTGDYYATVTWIAEAGTAIAVNSIAATPATMDFSEAEIPESQNITVLGIRGGLYTNKTITTSCSFVMDATSSEGFTVGLHTGTVTTGSSGSASHVGTVDISYYDATNGTLYDTVDLTMSA